DRYLQRKQSEINAGGDVEKVWKGARKTKTMATAFLVLKAMTGSRHRCAYSHDSLAADIDHFWPKKPHPGRAFIWTNMLPSCTPCNRVKGDLFPVATTGTPILIDPTVDDPWGSLCIRASDRFDRCARGFRRARGS